jgi:hypothetical protein
MLVKSRRYQIENADLIAARKKAQRATVKDQIRAYDKARYAANRESRLAASRAWRIKNATKVRESMAAKQRINPASMGALVQQNAERGRR